jgi:hypothetical protein
MTSQYSFVPVVAICTMVVSLRCDASEGDVGNAPLAVSNIQVHQPPLSSISFQPSSDSYRNSVFVVAVVNNQSDIAIVLRIVASFHRVVESMQQGLV